MTFWQEGRRLQRAGPLPPPKARVIPSTRRLPFKLPPPGNGPGAARRARDVRVQVSVVSLGSRKALCVNDELRGRVRGGEGLNEGCLDLQQAARKAKVEAKKGDSAQRGAGATGDGPSKGSNKGCAYLQPGSVEVREAQRALQARHALTHHRSPRRCFDVRRATALLAARPTTPRATRHALLTACCLPLRRQDRLLNTPHDVEELMGLGKRTGCCPYYGARKSVEDAQLILLPYASLLHADTRASLGVELAGAVVVIDEAHNLIDTVNETHSVTLTARQLSEVQQT